MGTSRMYTDANGDTTWQPVELSERQEWLDGFDAASIKFGIRPPDVEQGWHPAPMRQFVIILSGALQVTYTDGSQKVFGAGEARLMDNITGKGHKTIAVGGRALRHRDRRAERSNAAHRPDLTSDTPRWEMGAVGATGMGVNCLYLPSRVR